MRAESLVTVALFIVLFAFVNLVLCATQTMPVGDCFFVDQDDECFAMPAAVSDTGTPDFTMIIKLYDNQTREIEQIEYFFLDGGWPSGDNSFQIAVDVVTVLVLSSAVGCVRGVRRAEALRSSAARVGFASLLLVLSMLYFAAVGVDSAAISEWGTLCEDPYLTEQFGPLLIKAKQAAIDSCDPAASSFCTAGSTFTCDTDRFWLTLCFNFLCALFMTIFACLLAYLPELEAQDESLGQSLLDQEHGGVAHFKSDEEEPAPRSNLPPAQGPLRLDAYQPVGDGRLSDEDDPLVFSAALDASEEGDAIEMRPIGQEDIDDL